MSPVEQLNSVGACSEAVDFVRAGNFATLNDAWLACDRGDWMLWLAGKKSGAPESEGRKKLVLAACECARLALPLFEKPNPGDARVRAYIDTTERWARGEAKIEKLRATRFAAFAAFTAADVADAAAASAACAAYAAFAACAAYGVYAAYAEAVAERKRVLQLCADIVRRHYPEVPQ